jgi:hypothetical protein
MEFIYEWCLKFPKTIVRWVNQCDFPPQLKTSTLCMPWWSAQIAYTFNIYLATQNTRFVKNLWHQLDHWCQPRGCKCYLGGICDTCHFLCDKRPNQLLNGWMWCLNVQHLTNLVAKCHKSYKVMKLKVYIWELCLKIEWNK